MQYYSCHCTFTLVFTWLGRQICFQIVCLSIVSVPNLCLKDPQIWNASHHTGLDTRPMTQMSILAGVWGRRSRARAELESCWTMLVIDSHSAMWASSALQDMYPYMSQGTDAWLELKLEQEVQCYTMLLMASSHADIITQPKVAQPKPGAIPWSWKPAAEVGVIR